LILGRGEKGVETFAQKGQRVAVCRGPGGGE